MGIKQKIRILTKVNLHTREAVIQTEEEIEADGIIATDLSVRSVRRLVT